MTQGKLMPTIVMDELVADSPTVTIPTWNKDPNLMDWLKNYGKNSL